MAWLNESNTGDGCRTLYVREYRAPIIQEAGFHTLVDLVVLTAALCFCRLCPCPVMGYQDKDNKYLPPYNWWADSAAQHLIDVVNKYYQGTGFSFFLSQVSDVPSGIITSEVLGLPAGWLGVGECQQAADEQGTQHPLGGGVAHASA